MKSVNELSEQPEHTASSKGMANKVQSGLLKKRHSFENNKEYMNTKSPAAVKCCIVKSRENEVKQDKTPLEMMIDT